MLKHYLAGFAIMIGISVNAQETGTSILKKMHDKYKGGICKSYTFSQKNTHYNNDTVVGNSEWHEAVEFPDKFRIVFGDKTKGNSVLFRKDSVLNYRNYKLTKSSADSNNLLLLLGGMYYRNFDDVTTRLAAAGYDLSAGSEQAWNGKKVLVIGAKPGETEKNQIWVDADKLLIVRIIEKMNATDWMDMRFESHEKLCNGFVENKVSFRRNGKLEQVEEYFDIKPNAPFNAR
jgi:hypothetical protein